MTAAAKALTRLKTAVLALRPGRSRSFLAAELTEAPSGEPAGETVMAVLIYAMELGDEQLALRAHQYGRQGATAMLASFGYVAPELAETLELLIRLLEEYGYEQVDGQWRRPPATSVPAP